MRSPGFVALLMALRLAAHRRVGVGPCPASRPRRGGAAALSLLLGASVLACGEGMPAAEKAARGACQGLTREDLRPEADRLEFLREKEQLAAQAANDDPRFDALYDARRDLRQATEDKDSEAALAHGLLVVKECRALDAG